MPQCIIQLHKGLFKEIIIVCLTDSLNETILNLGSLRALCLSCLILGSKERSPYLRFVNVAFV